ncbi:MAG: dihydroxy-acid dehydratase, partial [Clostridia bacterium]|nr:dihydroxy-acid dehydratase [Clostridia bacterium]
IIDIDIPANSVNVRVDEAKLQARRADLKEKEPNIKSGWLARYSRLVTGADKGAVLK